VVGTVPVVIAGVLLEKKIDTIFRDPRLTGVMLIVFALVLAVAEKMAKQRRQIVDVNKKDGWIVGAAQAIALIPGASRSGTTITAGLLRNLNREAAARFSFLLSVPAVLLSGLYKLKDVIRPHAPLPGAPLTMQLSTGDLALATLVSFFVGYASIAFLLRYLRTNSTMVFVVYRVAAGALILYLAATGFLR
jgi:undecaprenyl-diphosphatase